MNRKIILFLVGRIVLLESALLALPLLCSLIYGEKCTFAFLITIAIAITVGIVLTLLGKTTNRTFFAKEGFVQPWKMKYRIVSIIKNSYVWICRRKK